MTDENNRDQITIFENLAHLLYRQRQQANMAPDPLDQRIVQALTGQPIKATEPEVLSFRKAG